jgi:hypothetical protein
MLLVAIEIAMRLFVKEVDMGIEVKSLVGLITPQAVYDVG